VARAARGGAVRVSRHEDDRREAGDDEAIVPKSVSLKRRADAGGAIQRADHPYGVELGGIQIRLNKIDAHT
jgi:hypothetical protein